jgi:diadenylate cyclase
MTEPHPLDIKYEDHATVKELLDIIQFCVEDISLGFDRWDEPYTRGPGLYIAIVSGCSLRDYADAMGNNYWPVKESRHVLDDITSFYATAKEVAAALDGAVVISVDGVIQPQMVRFRDLSTVSSHEQRTNTSSEYAEWMGSRHMSALDTSVRTEVVATITLSAENGRVTVFRNGEFTANTRDELSAEWRVSPSDK